MVFGGPFGRGRSEDGFTLIELMVVVLIVALLIALAIPTFMGARKRAQRRQAQSGVRNVLTVVDTYYADAQRYSAAPADLTSIEPELDYVNAPSTDPNTISVDVNPADDQIVALAVWSKSKDCYFIYHDARLTTVFGRSETGGLNSCDADATDSTPGLVQGPW